MMNLLQVAAGVAIDTIRQLDDDYIEIRLIPWYIRHSSTMLSDGQVQMIGEAVLRALFERGARFGQLDGSTGNFVEASVQGPVDAIMSSWRKLGRDPKIGEIGWLDLMDLPDD